MGIYKYGLDESIANEALEAIRSGEATLFAMSGKMGAGKDLIGDEILRQLRLAGHEFVSISFGHFIRYEIASIIDAVFNGANDFMVSGSGSELELAESIGADVEELRELIRIIGNRNICERSEESRKALQYWGTNVRRKQDYNYWIKKMAEFIAKKITYGTSVIVTDARFPNEVEVVEAFSGKIIRLKASEETRAKRIEQRDGIVVNLESMRHSSEMALDDYPFDRVFDGEQTPEQLRKEGLDYVLSR